MKAKLELIDHDRINHNLFPKEKYCFVGRSSSPDNLQIRLGIEGDVLKAPLIKWDQKDWEYDIEIAITAKPKQEALIIKL